ncbi:hypothetical protein ACOSP6_14610 [Tenacibaculum sp. MEBiC06402]|uniref:hypothetical protein n=1 Tax=unclassified Tenacibaculum TaxID=2635139 RepID=UPI003B9B3FF0
MFRRLTFLIVLQVFVGCNNEENSAEFNKLKKQLREKEEVISDLNKKIERLRVSEDSVVNDYYRFVKSANQEINVEEQLFAGKEKIIDEKFFTDTLDVSDNLIVYEHTSTIKQTTQSDFEAVLKDFQQEKSIYGDDFFVRVMTFYNGESLSLESENSKTNIHILIQPTELGYENKTFVISDFFDVKIVSLNKKDNNKIELIIEHGAFPRKKEIIIISPELVKFKEFMKPIDLNLFYGVWAYNISDPHAQFMINKDEFYLADSDGDSSFKYVLEDNRLKVFYEEATQVGEVISVSKDSLKIKWGNEEITNYVRFPNN